MHWRRKWQPTSVLLPGESQGRGSLEGCHLWVTQSWTRLKRLSSSGSSCTLSQALYSVQFSRSVVSNSATSWTAACQASLPVTNSQSLLKLMSILSVMPSNHLMLCHPLLLPPSIFPSIRVFSSESVLCIRWPHYWSFSFSISASNEYSGLISFRIDWF